MSHSTYGIMTRNNGYIDTSTTERGAKQYATLNGYKEVYRRSPLGDYNVFHIATRVELLSGRYAWMTPDDAQEYNDKVAMIVHNENVLRGYANIAKVQAINKHNI